MNEHSGKPEYTLLPPAELREMVMAFMVGQHKYATDDWKKLTVKNRVNGALRHIEAYRDGEQFDVDKVHHLACAAANLLMALHNSGDLASWVVKHRSWPWLNKKPSSDGPF